jgi:hypothetical protein
MGFSLRDRTAQAPSLDRLAIGTYMVSFYAFAYFLETVKAVRWL